jgi:hypothetical protein
MFMNLLKMIGMKVMGKGMMGRMYRLLYLGIEVHIRSYDEMYTTWRLHTLFEIEHLCTMCHYRYLGSRDGGYDRDARLDTTYCDYLLYSLPIRSPQLLPIKQAWMRKKGISVQNILQQRGTTTVRIINDLLLYTSVISDNLL